MRSVLCFLLTCFFVLDVIAQSPGGIATNNTMWIRADAGITSAANIVSQWQELSGANVTGNFTVQPLFGTVNIQTGPTIIEPGINFNPYIRFDGFTNSLSSINLFPGTSLVSNNNITVFQVFNLKGGIVWLKWETDQVGASGRMGFENSFGNIRSDFPIAVANSLGQNGQNVGNINVLNKYALSTAYADASVSVNRLNGTDNTFINNPGTGDFSLVNDKIVIGNENLINLPAQIDMAEIIIYARTLSQAERNKIESYLAIKYGFTLDQAAANSNDYSAANGTIVWNRSANSGYANNITGLGRDDASGLMQKQSKSINAQALVTLYNGIYTGGNFPLTNAVNTNTFASDRSFMLIGDNGMPLTIDQCIFNGKGQRMQRIWKVSKIGSSVSQTFSIDQPAVPASVKYLISSTDPTFPAAATIVHSLTAANGKLYTDAILNDGNYFSFSTDTVVVNFVTTAPTCSNPNSGSIAPTVTGGSGPFTYSWNPSGQETADLTNVVAGNYTLTITQGACPSTHDVILNNATSLPAPVVNGVPSCIGYSVILVVQNPEPSYTYNWYDVPTGGIIQNSGTSFITPLIFANTTFYVEAVSGSCSSDRIPVLVSLVAGVGPIVNPVTICAGTSAILNILNPVAGSTYNWYTTATGGVAVGTGITFTTTPLSASTTFYAQTGTVGCTSLRTPVLVNVNAVIAAPVANGATICAGSTATLNIQNPDVSNTYNWYTAATGISIAGTGTSFTTPVLNDVTTYYVEAFNNNCSSTRIPVIVNINTLAPVANSNAICPGNVATLSVQNPSIIYTYNWYASPTGGIALATGPVYTTAPVPGPATYYVEASDGACTSIRTSVAVNFVPSLDTPRVFATTIAPESITFSWPPVAGASGYIISIDGGNTYNAPSSGNTGLSHTINNLAHSQTVAISVIAINAAQGCGNSSPGHAKATTYGDGFYVPNAFTPNNSFPNDILKPIIPGGFTLDYFTIFNRWGQKIFSIQTIGVGWDGKWNGKEQPLGTYVWICRYHYPGGRIIDEKGTVMIIR